MKAERWQQVERLYHSTLEKEAGERAAFLAEACAGDDSLRREVESLLAYEDQAEDFIESPALAVAAGLLADTRRDSLVGQTIAHYRVRSLVGAGGMGEVYLAEDTALGRRVALKLLPEHFTHDKNQVRRFRREARAASALNHPNILTVHEVGQVDGMEFIAAEYVEGETLRERLRRAPFGVGEALDVAAQVAAALAAAHEAGITHRDIKPENVMVRRDGYVKVLDFGLAKLTENLSGQPGDFNATAGSAVRTNPGVLMGTAGYMSPEQARGLETDARTDIWSLGVVLYEMVAGRAPFEGETPSHVIVSILESEPPPLARFAEAPAELERIVTKALRKDREERYQAASDLALDLKGLKQELEVEARLKRSLQSDTGGSQTTLERDGRAAVETARDSAAQTTDAATARPTSSAEYLVGGIRRHRRGALLAAAALIVAALAAAYLFFARGGYFAAGGEAIDSVAVLPFVNVSGSPDTEYLSDGISDSLIDSLSQLPNLNKVISLSSVLRYKGKQTDPQAVGRELNVRAVLTGRLVQRGDELLISTELVDVKDNRRLWGGQYTRKLADVPTLQGEIAREIADRLRLRLTGEEKQRLAKRETDNPEAYQLYLKGRFLRRNRVSNQEAISYLEQAIKLDPNFAAAYAQIAYAYLSMTAGGQVPPQEVRAKREAAVTRGLEIDDTNGDLHMNLASLKNLAQDFPGFEREGQRALELDPNSADIHAFYARGLWSRRRFDEAILHMRRAEELDPLSPALCNDLGKILYSAGQRELATEQYRKALELNPNYADPHRNLSRYYLAQGKYDEAIAEATKAREGAEMPSAYLGYVYAVVGRRSEAQKILHELEELSKRRHINPEAFALIYTGLGDKDRAFEYLQKQVGENPASLVFLQVQPEWDSLRSDPRYTDLLREMKFAP